MRKNCQLSLKPYKKIAKPKVPQTVGISEFFASAVIKTYIGIPYVSISELFRVNPSSLRWEKLSQQQNPSLTMKGLLYHLLNLP
jgi:hypothetical protein